MHRLHNLLYAVRKSTREVTTLGRERVLPWYMGKRSEMGNTNVTKKHQLQKDILREEERGI